MSTNADSSSSSLTGRWPSAPLSTRHWRSDDGRVSALHLGGHVFGFEIVGSLPDDALPFLESELSQAFEESGQAQLFWDAWTLERFGSGVRDGMTKLLVGHRSQWQSVHVLVRSSLVSMTVSALGLGLFGRLKSHREPDPFYAAVERALTAG